MLVTDLSYVKEQLARVTASERTEIAKALELNVKTIRRILRKPEYYPRADTLGKLVLLFKTREKRGRKAA